MKQLQNNFTTPEQSKRLIEIGVPADSADMAYRPVMRVSGLCPLDIAYRAAESPILLHHGKFSDVVFKNEELQEINIPCWSVGRLIEIASICSIYTIEFWRNDSPIDNIMYEFENNEMDFSKLEE